MIHVATPTNVNTVFDAHYCKPQMLDVTFLHFIHIMARFMRENTSHQPEKGLVVVGHIGETVTKQGLWVKTTQQWIFWTFPAVYCMWQQNFIYLFFLNET